MHIHLKTFQADSLVELETLVTDWFHDNPDLKLTDIVSGFMNVQSALIYTFWLLYEH